jgi:plasmid stabilization system protein ParE
MLLPAAAADIEDAYGWYEAQSDGLGDEFLSVFQATLECLQADPQKAPVVHGETRRHLMRRFPHVIFYRVIDANVVVLACFPETRAGLARRRTVPSDD